MPKKKHILSEEERRKRIRETAREIGTSDDPQEFERAFKKVVSAKRADGKKTI
ncbi:MAG: hypothetical protein ABSA49_02225 [Rhizomicrobium sp.]